MRAALLLVVGCVAACGGASDSGDGGAAGSSRAPVQPWGLSGAADPAPAGGSSAAACDTVIVFALDKILHDEIQRDGMAPGAATPRMDSILAGAMNVTDAITTSTAGNAALASLLTGRHVSEHGIVSLRDAARQTLPESEFTLAEGFQSAGWTTIFSSGSPLHARGFSGFRQGFDHFEAPRLSEPSRPAGATINGALLPLRAALARDERVFALISFDDLTARALRAPDPAVTAPFVRARLAPLAKERADIEAGLRALDVDAGKGLEELAQLLARARGSRASAAWNMALRDAHLSLIDKAVGQVLDALEASGRGERALIVVTGLRGTLPPGYTHEAGALFTRAAIHIPLAIRWPGGARRSEPCGETASLLDVPRALQALGKFELGETAFRAANLGASGPLLPRPALVVDSQRKLFAAVDGDVQLERYSDGQLLPFDRAGQKARSVEDSVLEPIARTLGAFVDSSTSTRLRFEWLGEDSTDAPGVAWETGGGAVQTALGSRPSVRGELGLSSGDAAAGAELLLTERATALRLRVTSARDSAIDPSLVRMGTEAAALDGAHLPLLFAPLDEIAPAKLSAESPPARLRFQRADGLAWTLSVDPAPGESSGTGTTEVLLSVWPPRDFSDALEVQAGGETKSHAVPGRLDMVRITGVAPFACRVKKLGKEDFTVACRTPEGFLPPTEMEFHGLRFADARGFELVVGAWQGAASAALPSLDPALYGALDRKTPESPGSPGLLIQRFDVGPLPMQFTPPDASDLAELVRLVPGE